ncbi:MAG: class I SAM-dependent methyltransferase [Planctomycetota bacterium]
MGKEKKGKGKAEKEKKPKGKKDKKPTRAEQADKYVLYQRSVQNPEADIEFFEQTFAAHYGRRPVTLREDFCGTYLCACDWVARREENRAWGVDLDPEPLAWGREHNQVKLTPVQAQRLTLIQGDVRDPRDFKVDIVAAQNFSYLIFKTREELRNYFRRCLEGLNEQGVLVLDIFGGPDSQRPAEDTTVYGKEGFSYVWDQVRYDAITNEIQCAIHFKFKDGSRLQNIFEYDWRLWTIAELREVLLEAGFSKAEAYWEGADEDGDGDGNFTLETSAENEDAWIAYVVGAK